MNPISAPGQAYTPWFTMPDPFIACHASPNALRRHTVSVGVVAICSACIMRMPQCSIRSCSTRRPTMKPGTSTRKTIGRLNASHTVIARMIL